ncbi:MAG: hypothetical protein KBD47_01020 [Candidatus Pacebacteria bacterium]|jgi:pimeloyl-ACP methyl ester carboxylesterase|nr:hypothetical protein [Candidatus Paceibacterota bacterium]
MRKILLFIVIFLPSLTHAETIVPAGIESDLWIKQYSPYIINSDTIVSGTLTIEPGVVVQMGHADIDSFKIVGSIQVKGSQDDPVIFESYGDEEKNWSLNIDSSEGSEIQHAIFRNSLNAVTIKDSKVSFRDVSFSRLSFCLSVDHSSISLVRVEFEQCQNGSIFSDQGDITLDSVILDGNNEVDGVFVNNYSSLNIVSSTFKNLSNAILSDNSTVRIDKTSFVDNRTGISTKLSDIVVEWGVFKNNDTAVAVFKNGPIFSGGEGNIFSPKDQVIIHNSEFVESASNDINNTSDITVDATNNWWGTDEGPKKNTGYVAVDPWIVRKKDCCSSILFIPGFQASRLSISGNQLWEPNRNADVEKLFLDEKGQSSTSVSVDSIIDKGIGYKIYDALIQALNNVVESGAVAAWQPFPYDWRRNQMDVALDILPTIQSLASSSITGKVNIVSHSNGGLIAKALLKLLRDKGKENLIDALVFIAVPHIGTPKAIASLLYGYDQQIAKGLILNKKIARQLGYNTPGAYGLLPSAFTAPTTGVASSSKDIESPMLLNKYLASEAKKLHQALDQINFPRMFSITGWNMPTPNSLSTTTLLGDGTVIASSSDIFKNSYFFDLKKYGQGIGHANITEATPVLALLKDIVLSTTDSQSAYTSFISKDYPKVSVDTLEIKMFSPVDIHVYDSEGRHTGPALNQQEREQEMDIEPGLISFVDEEIPGSSYSDMGVKTISVPNTGTYIIKGIGTDNGVFTLQTSVLNGEGEEKILARYEELPVLKDSKIELSLNTASTTPDNLKIDIENDGIFEKTIRPNKSKKKIFPYIKKHEYHRYLRDYFKD